MRRALLTLGGTAAGLAALLSFKGHSPAAASPADSAPAASQPAASGTGSSAAAPKASTNGTTPARTVTGPVANTPYGPMQVQVTLTGTKIAKVTVVQRTNDGVESEQIDNSAIPQLTSETIAAQSARIDAVSGATYTSSGYIKSLQSALDKSLAVPVP
jgi:uncharacterized protein with FMN-binding domain